MMTETDDELAGELEMTCTMSENLAGFRSRGIGGNGGTASLAVSALRSPTQSMHLELPEDRPSSGREPSKESKDTRRESKESKAPDLSPASRKANGLSRIITNWFEAFDLNGNGILGDGLVDVLEFGEWLTNVNATITVGRLGTTYDLADSLKPLYDCFDPEGTGISKDQFLRTYRVIANSLKHTPVPAQEKMDIWVRAAEDDFAKDMMIDFEDFVQWQVQLLNSSGTPNALTPQKVQELADALKVIQDIDEQGSWKGDVTEALSQAVTKVATKARELYLPCKVRQLAPEGMTMELHVHDAFLFQLTDQAIASSSSVRGGFAMGQLELFVADIHILVKAGGTGSSSTSAGLTPSDACNVPSRSKPIVQASEDPIWFSWRRWQTRAIRQAVGVILCDCGVPGCDDGGATITFAGYPRSFSAVSPMEVRETWSCGDPESFAWRLLTGRPTRCERFCTAFSANFTASRTLGLCGPAVRAVRDCAIDLGVLLPGVMPHKASKEAQRGPKKSEIPQQKSSSIGSKRRFALSIMTMATMTKKTTKGLLLVKLAMALGALRFLSFVAETSFVGAGSGVSPVSRVALRAEEKEGDGKEDTWEGMLDFLKVEQDIELSPDEPVDEKQLEKDARRTLKKNGIKDPSGQDVDMEYEDSEIELSVVDEDVMVQWAGGMPGTKVGYIIERKPAGSTNYEEIATYDNMQNPQLLAKRYSGHEYSYTDSMVAPGKYDYRLLCRSRDGGITVVDQKDIIVTEPAGLDLKLAFALLGAAVVFRVRGRLSCPCAKLKSFRDVYYEMIPADDDHETLKWTRSSDGSLFESMTQQLPKELFVLALLKTQEMVHGNLHWAQVQRSIGVAERMDKLSPDNVEQFYNVLRALARQEVVLQPQYHEQLERSNGGPWETQSFHLSRCCSCYMSKRLRLPITWHPECTGALMKTCGALRSWGRVTWRSHGSTENSVHAKVVLAVGRGAMLDFAKAVACMVPLRGASPGRTGRAGLLRTEQFLLQTGGEMSREAATLLPGASLPLLLAPSHATVAATSGRCLLRDAPGKALVPLALAGPGPFGVGVGIQATQVLADVSLTRHQSARGRTAAVAHAMSIFEKQLVDDMMVGLGSSFSALRQPMDAEVDVLEAVLRAGVSAADADANARGELCVVHALASVLAGTRDVPFPLACRVLLPLVLRAWAEHSELCEPQVTSLSAIASALLGTPQLSAATAATALLRLADWIDGACSAGGLAPQLPTDAEECAASAAALLAMHTEEAPVAQQRPRPSWVEPEALTKIFRNALEEKGGAVVPRADRPPVIPPSLRRDAARDVATPVRPQGAADEPPAKRAKRRRSAAEKLLARAELEAKSRTGEARPSHPSHRASEKLFEALQVSNLGFLSPDLQRQWRKPKASVWQRLQHLASLDRLLLGLWAEEHAADQKLMAADAGATPYPTPAANATIAALFDLRSIRKCLVKAEGCSRKQMLRYVTHWQLVGRDVTARYLAFVIPSPKVLREIQKRCGSGGLVELGAGMGYWSHLLANSGVEVVALDVDPPEKSRFKVQLGDASSLPKLQRELLLLCMPPPGEAACADEALRHFTGRASERNRRLHRCGPGRW
eukprot:g9224.t2